MTARMKGWRVRSFPERRFHHHRSMGTAERGEVSALFSYGEKDYYLGGSPIWQMFRVTYRMTKRPVHCWRAGPRVRLHVGGTAPGQATGQPGTDALSSSGSDEEAQGNPPKAFESSRGRQFFAWCRKDAPFTLMTSNTVAPSVTARTLHKFTDWLERFGETSLGSPDASSPGRRRPRQARSTTSARSSGSRRSRR